VQNSPPTIVITGGAGGLGTAIALRLRDDGATVVSLDRVPATAANASHVLDVADETAMAGAFADVAARHHGIDGLVCAAGSVVEHPVATMPLAAWRSVIDASLTGTFLAARAALPLMVAAGRGSIVAFSSGYASNGYRNGANYAAAKAGIEALIKSIALENAAHGIRANSIAPGPIETPMLAPARAAIVAPLIPMGRVGQPQDVVGLVRFLLGDESAYITGQTIHVNGGLSMR
jgi:NAD(P)-dependent dehydrogenase (short-subunit alcohol dehydrogenase family)